jgi:beta-glucosidase/6-phospho-beta-glucosidase/beta-galactosidase
MRNGVELSSMITQESGSSKPAPVEVWGGVECTYNRVRDTFFDQIALSGHESRRGDFVHFAEIGIRKLRYGLLWERHEANPSWRWSDERMTDLASLGICPIIGLVHHGSGPPHTHLLDSAFPGKLAAYAGEVAARYPHVEAYTPVNEPNTTARFSGLYGIWYPHHISRQSYLRALLHELKATVLSMRAIRNVRSDAQLIQTEDIGRIWSTAQLATLRDLLDERRWLPFDLLCGLVSRSHPMFHYMHEAGLSEREILWFEENPCRPSVIGVNYYLTSDRYLDHRLRMYPDDRRSVEGAVADIEAVRVRPEGIAGFQALLVEAWARYRIPVAITEVHLGTDVVADQIRWAAEAWHGAQNARTEGAQIVALTFWALLGSYFWSALVCHDNGHYEVGMFDVRGGTPVPSGLAEFARQLASGATPDHPALSRNGWWRENSRLLFADAEEHVWDSSAA